MQGWIYLLLDGGICAGFVLRWGLVPYGERVEVDGEIWRELFEGWDVRH